MCVCALLEYMDRKSPLQFSCVSYPILIVIYSRQFERTAITTTTPTANVAVKSEVDDLAVCVCVCMAGYRIAPE
jgi:hypothetical protein